MLNFLRGGIYEEEKISERITKATVYRHPYYGILGWGLGSFASCIYYLSLWEALKVHFSAISHNVNEFLEEPYDYRFTYLKWLMILLLVPAIAMSVSFLGFIP